MLPQRSESQDPGKSLRMASHPPSKDRVKVGDHYYSYHDCQVICALVFYVQDGRGLSLTDDDIAETVMYMHSKVVAEFSTDCRDLLAMLRGKWSGHRSTDWTREIRADVEQDLEWWTTLAKEQCMHHFWFLLSPYISIYELWDTFGGRDRSTYFPKTLHGLRIRLRREKLTTKGCRLWVSCPSWGACDKACIKNIRLDCPGG